MGQEIATLRSFFLFQEMAINRFGEEIKVLANPSRLQGFISQTQKITLGRMIDMFAVLDSLKNMSPLNNDYAMYSRATNYLSRGQTVNPEEMMEQMKERRFLAEPKSITNQLQQVCGLSELAVTVSGHLRAAGRHLQRRCEHMGI